MIQPPGPSPYRFTTRRSSFSSALSSPGSTPAATGRGARRPSPERSYGLGLFEPISTFRIRYLLGREWTLQAEQGVGTSADFLYTVERGKGGATPAPVREKGEEVKAPAGTTGGSPPP